MTIYESCPVIENDNFKLRLVSLEDCCDLLKVYSDEKAVSLFNSDNCGGDDFHYTTYERMKQAIEYWLFEYDRKGFVRFSIVDKKPSEAVGTIELFNRVAEDYFNNCGLLRLDLRSDYEKENVIKDILSLIVFKAFDLFCCDKVAIKAIPEAKERIKAIEELGFVRSEEKLIGTHDLINYDSYYVLIQ